MRSWVWNGQEHNIDKIHSLGKKLFLSTHSLPGSKRKIWFKYSIAMQEKHTTDGGMISSCNIWCWYSVLPAMMLYISADFRQAIFTIMQIQNEILIWFWSIWNKMKYFSELHTTWKLRVDKIRLVKRDNFVAAMLIRFPWNSGSITWTKIQPLMRCLECSYNFFAGNNGGHSNYKEAWRSCC